MMRLGLDDLIELRELLVCYVEALDWADGSEDPRIRRWTRMIDDGIAEIQKEILMAAVEATGGWEPEVVRIPVTTRVENGRIIHRVGGREPTGPSGPPHPSVYVPLPGGPTERRS